MTVEQIYTGCLAEAAYYIESNGEAAIVDPLREIEPYIEKAKGNNASIKYVLETHFHADFVSGHLDLAKATGAKIVYGPTAQPGFEAYVAQDEEILPLGDLKIKVLHTPGHTMESTTYLLLNKNDEPQAIFTGDTLFIGDVGRPDLAVKTDLSQEDLAGHLYDSLRNKIMPLPDNIVIYPGHGAGSACGKNMSSETVDMLGHQKKTNYALRPDMTKKEFIKEVLTGLAAPPQYFPKNAVMNKSGYESIDDVFKRGLHPLNYLEFEKLVEEDNALILDTRPQKEYKKAAIPGSIWIGIEDNFAPWVGALIEDLNQPIVLLTEPGTEKEVITRLARVGYDYALGYLEGGIATWEEHEETYSTEEIDAKSFADLYVDQSINILDVRKESEFEAQHVLDAINYPLNRFIENVPKLNKNETYYVYCQGGYRSIIAISMLKSRGYENLVNIKGGFNEIKQHLNALSEYHEPISML